MNPSLTEPVPLTGSEPSVDQHVLHLLDQWERECAHLSSSSRRRQHPALQQVIEVGMAAVPVLVRHYHRAPRMIEGLLRTITGASPSEGLETFEEWRASWIGWSRARELPV